MRDGPVISIENYTIYCGNADENKVGAGGGITSTPSRCTVLRLLDRRGIKLWIVSAHAPTETPDDKTKDAFYDELNALMFKIPSHQMVIVGIDANLKMEHEQQSDVVGK
ncbi:hypothetical protein RB195_025408 [Necator americanus]|uniref:Endonuclease/exonuclease/phosphatase domain-containing protein n=1 Tax=Necator americanus TaxID=51031 RepID=A0ABR1ES60_NECAM